MYGGIRVRPVRHTAGPRDWGVALCEDRRHGCAIGNTTNLHTTTPTRILAPMITQKDEYFFDLKGFTVIPDSLDQEHVKSVDRWVDALPPLETGQWFGNVYVQSYGETDEMNLQDVIEAGEIFEGLIDHPFWIEKVRHYLGPSTAPYIYEIFVNVREPGGYIGVHSGGHNVDHYIRSGRRNGQWVCPMLTVLVPLTDVGQGDGATVLIPGSHKSDLPHPGQDKRGRISDGPGEDLEGTEDTWRPGTHCFSTMPFATDPPDGAIPASAA